MTDKFRNKYRIASARAQWWDYSTPGIYFITLCAFRHECLFGKIHIVETHGGASPEGGASLQGSPIGGIVLQEWHKSFNIRVELNCDAFVLMPNHLHAILRIDHSVLTDSAIGGDSASQVVNSTTGVAYRPPKSISSFVAGFKSAATKKINVLRNTPGAAVWQPRFHDHIIHNMTEYQRIADYIENNPANWSDDRFWVDTVL